MIILAGSVIVSLSNSGIIGKAEDAVNKSDKAAYKTEAELFVGSLNLKIVEDENLKEGYNDITSYLSEYGKNAPVMGWVFIENKQIKEYGFYYKDMYMSNIEGEFDFEKLNASKLVNIKDYGAVGDGITDDTAAIKTAIEELNENGGALYFPIGTYLVSASASKDSVINLNSNKDILIDFYGSTIQLAANDYAYYDVIKATNCSNVVLRNGVLIGDRMTHDYSQVDADNTHEFGYGINSNQSKNVLIHNMDISNMTGDAVFNRSGESGGTTTVRNCNLHHCRRQGLTILDSDITKVENTEIHHIGTFDGIAGTNPMSGIDIEPDSGTFVANSVILDNVNIYDTTRWGVVNGKSNANEIKIYNSNIEDLNIVSYFEAYNTKLNYNRDNEAGMVLTALIDNCHLNFIKWNQVTIKGETSILNSTLEGIGEKKTTQIFIEGVPTIKNTILKNILGRTGNLSASSGDAGIVYPEGYVSSADSHNNTFENCVVWLSNATFDEKNTVFKNSRIVAYYETIFKNIQMVNCTTAGLQSPSYTAYTFENCNLDLKDMFYNDIKKIYNSQVTVKNVETINCFGTGSVIDNSTIKVTGECSIKSFYRPTLSNNSKIILERYNNVNKLNIPNSTEGTDYTVTYNGSETLS